MRECINTRTVVPLAEVSVTVLALGIFRGVTLSKTSYQELLGDSTLSGKYSQIPLIETLRGPSKVSVYMWCLY